MTRVLRSLQGTLSWKTSRNLDLIRNMRKPVCPFCAEVPIAVAKVLS